VLERLRPLAVAIALGFAQARGGEPEAEEPREPAAGETSASNPSSTSTSTPTPPSTPTSTPTPPSTPTPTPTPPDRDGDGKNDNWLDVGHAFIEHRIFAPILRLDRFFSDERDLDAERSRSFVRWRNEVHFTEDASDPSFTTGVRANLRLPGLNQQLQRIRVIIQSDTRDALQSVFPRGPGQALTDEDTFGGRGNAGLRLYFLDTLFAHADLGAGVLTRLPPGVYGQLRFRAAVPVGKAFLTRSVLAGFWRTDTRFGTSAGLELERPLTTMFVTRLSNTATLTELSRGIEWFSEAALFAQVSETAAAQLAFAVNGATRPPLASSDGVTFTRPPGLDRYRVYTRVRRDMYRRWIFVEIEPELAWPWTLENHRHKAWGVSFRVEFQFQGTEAPPPHPPEPEPEPADPPPVDAAPSSPPPR
jgi:hypothetical protein